MKNKYFSFLKKLLFRVFRLFIIMILIGYLPRLFFGGNTEAIAIFQYFLCNCSAIEAEYVMPDLLEYYGGLAAAYRKTLAIDCATQAVELRLGLATNIFCCVSSECFKSILLSTVGMINSATLLLDFRG